MTTNADDILSMLVGEFGKKPAKTAKPKKVANTATDTARTAMQNETSEANRIAKLMAANSPWRPTALVVHIVEQECRCCLTKVEIIGNILIKHIHKTTGAEWDCLLPEDPRQYTLPREIFTHQQSVAQCPTCLRTEFFHSSTDRIISRQRPLFS